MKNVMITSWAQVRFDIEGLCRAANMPAPQFPRMVSSNRYFVYSDAWVKAELLRKWKEFKIQNRFVYIPGSGMCEHFTRKFNLGMRDVIMPIVGVGPVTHPGYRDILGITDRLGDMVGGVFETNVEIPAGYGLNDVPDSLHSTTVILTTTNGNTINYNWLEPQNEKFTLVSDALKAGVNIWDFNS